MHYAAALHTLEHLTISRGIRPGLTRISALLEKLGDPHKGLMMVHVAGTNGKGTVCRMISTALAHCGYRTGEYTSPHLVSYCERFQINGAMISEKEFTSIFKKVWDAASTVPHITEFEILTGMAFEYFRQHQVDIAVLETGLGGRFDATNIVTPLVSVITSIGFDHQDLLGNTIKKIAFEKAGIIKPGVPVVIGALPAEATSEIRRIARSRKSNVIQARRVTLKTDMTGTQQGINTGIALAVRDVLGKKLTLPKNKYISGIQRAYLPGRLQSIKKRGQPLLILDGGHNEEASRTLADNLRTLYPRRKKTMIVGILKRKDARAVLQNLLPEADTIIFTAPSKEFHPVKKLTSIVKGLSPFSASGIKLKSVRDSGFGIRGSGFGGKANLRPHFYKQPSLQTAIKLAQEITAKKDMICLTGSFYLLGDFLREHLW